MKTKVLSEKQQRELYRSGNLQKIEEFITAQCPCSLIQKRIIERDDIDSALMFAKRYKLSEYLREFLLRRGSANMKWVFMLPFGRIKVASPKDACEVALEKGISVKGDFERCMVKVYTTEDTFGTDRTGYLAGNLSDGRVFVPIVDGEVMSETGSYSFSDPKPFV